MIFRLLSNKYKLLCCQLITSFSDGIIIITTVLQQSRKITCSTFSRVQLAAIKSYKAKREKPPPQENCMLLACASHQEPISAHYESFNLPTAALFFIPTQGRRIYFNICRTKMTYILEPIQMEELNEIENYLTNMAKEGILLRRQKKHNSARRKKTRPFFP